MSKQEKLKVLDAKIAAAQEAGDEEEYKYLLNIKNMTINVNEGGTVVFQSGNPKPLPPY